MYTSPMPAEDEQQKANSMVFLYIFISYRFIEAFLFKKNGLLLEVLWFLILCFLCVCVWGGGASAFS